MLSRSFEEFSVVTYIGKTQSRRLDLTLWNEAAELFSTLQNILCFRTIDRRTIERGFNDLLVRERNVEARTKLAKLSLVQFFLLMRDVSSLAGFTQPVSLHRLGQYHSRGPSVVDGRLVCRVYFFRIMSTPQQLANLVIGQVIDHF